MIRTAIAIVALLLLTATAVAESRTYHDSLGREVGRSEQRGSSTIYFDRMGRQTGRSERRGDQTIFFNERGERVGTERERSSAGGRGSSFGRN